MTMLLLYYITITLIRRIVRIVNIVIVVKNLLARVTLLAPMQFPMIPVDVSWMPNGTMYIIL